MFKVIDTILSYIVLIDQFLLDKIKIEKNYYKKVLGVYCSCLLIKIIFRLICIVHYRYLYRNICNLYRIKNFLKYIILLLCILGGFFKVSVFLVMFIIILCFLFNFLLKKKLFITLEDLSIDFLEIRILYERELYIMVNYLRFEHKYKCNLEVKGCIFFLDYSVRLYWDEEKLLRHPINTCRKVFEFVDQVIDFNKGFEEDIERLDLITNLGEWGLFSDEESLREFVFLIQVFYIVRGNKVGMLGVGVLGDFCKEYKILRKRVKLLV